MHDEADITIIIYLFQAVDDGHHYSSWYICHADILDVIYRVMSHSRNWMASSFTGWGGCPLVQISWRWDGSSLLHCMDNPQESPWLKLGTICVPTNRRNYCISWPIMSVPSTDMNLYLNIQTGSFKYPHLKNIIGNAGSDNLSCIDSVLLGWMDLISCWCRAKARRPTIALTKKTLNVLPLHSQRWLLQSMHQERG